MFLSFYKGHRYIYFFLHWNDIIYMGMICLFNCNIVRPIILKKDIWKKKIIFSILISCYLVVVGTGKITFPAKGRILLFYRFGEDRTRTCSTYFLQAATTLVESTSIGNTKSNLPNNLSKTLPDWNLVEQTPKFSILVLSSPPKYDSDIIPPKKCNFSKN